MQMQPLEPTVVSRLECILYNLNMKEEDMDTKPLDLIGVTMKRLTLTLILTFGLALSASGQNDNPPLGKPETCKLLADIMEFSQVALYHLTDNMANISYFLEEGDEDAREHSWDLLIFGGIEPPMSGKGDYFTNLEKLVRSATHAHEMARDAYESACLKDDKY